VRTTASAATLLRASLLGLTLGASFVFSAICLALVLQFGSDQAGSGRTVVQNDFFAFQSIARFASEGRPELAYQPDALLALERELAKDPELKLLPAAYPPWFALMIRPLGAMDTVQAYRLWVASTLAAAALVALLIARRWWMLPVALTLPAAAFSAAAGQNGNLSAALLGAGLWLLPTRPVLAGMAFGLMAYKPQLALALPFCLLAGGHFKALASAALTLAAMIAASIAVFGPAPLLAFVANLVTETDRFFGDLPLDLWHRMPTVMVGVLQLTGHRTAATLLHAAVALAALAALVGVWRSTDRDEVRALALVASMPLVSPYLFDYDLAVAIVPIAFLLGRGSGEAWTPSRLLVIAALWLTAPWLTYGPEAVRWPLGPLVWSALLGHALLEARREGFRRRLAL
jgi:hypothetical protein